MFDKEILNKIKQKIELLDKNQFDNKKIGLMITAFNRPFYFEKVVESINLCDELEEVPIIIFLDGGVKSRKKENIEIAKKIKYPNKFIIANDKNYGCDRNMLGAMFAMFDLGFDYVFGLEDDLVLSKNYFKYLYDNFLSIKQKDPQAGMFQGWNECLLSYDEKIKNKDIILDNIHANQWGYIMDKDTFNSISPILIEYLNIFLDTPFDGTAKEFRDIYLRQKIIDLYSKTIFNYSILVDDYIKNNILTKYPILGCDGIIDISLRAKKHKRYIPLVNRSLCVGEFGVHQTPDLWNSMNIKDVKLDIIGD